MRADGSLQSVGTRGLPTPAPLPPSQLRARRGLPAPRTGPTRPGHVAAWGSSGPGPALGALMVCWSGPRPVRLPTAQAARLCPARCSVLERGLPEDKESSVCFMQHAADKEQNTHSDRFQETARAGAAEERPLPSKPACRWASRKGPAGPPQPWPRASRVTRCRRGEVRRREGAGGGGGRGGLGRGPVWSPQP